MRIVVERGPVSSYVVQADNGANLLVQVDWDMPGLASAFGWVACFCGETDGTVDCPHRKAREMISSAREYLDQHVGESAEDPGYFVDQ
ncbi:MAG: hypothetical protein AB7O68_00695 [Pirellulales bacterium]